MSKQDQILRARAILSALKTNLPEGYEVSDRWVSEFLVAVEKVEKATSIDLAEFKVSTGDIGRSIASGNYLSGEVRYRQGLWCKRDILMQKIESLLIYLASLQSGGRGVNPDDSAEERE